MEKKVLQNRPLSGSLILRQVKFVFNCLLPLKNGFIRKVILRHLATGMASGSSTAVEHLPHHPMVGGLSPATADDTGREKMPKNYMNVPRGRI